MQKKIEPEFGSIFKAVRERASKASFLQDTATQITLNGNLDNLPLYVKIEDGIAEVAPYEYINAPFYIDADAETFAAVLSGQKDCRHCTGKHHGQRRCCTGHCILFKILRLISSLYIIHDLFRV